MAVQNYRVRLVRGDNEFEAEGDLEFVTRMIARFEGDVTPDTPQPKVAKRRAPLKGEATVSETAKAVSVREFVQRLALKKHTDITLAFGYYLEKYVGSPQFTPADINNLYYEAKLDISNTSQMIIQNIKRGFIMAAKGAKKGARKYTLTNSGERFIEAKLTANPE